VQVPEGIFSESMASARLCVMGDNLDSVRRNSKDHCETEDLGSCSLL
jgi:hypothetical protein